MVIYLLWDNPMVLGYAGFVFSVGAILAIGIVTPSVSQPKGEKFWHVYPYSFRCFLL